MGKINLLRVDDRLIHGQVMTKWSKGLGTNAVYVIDNVTAADDFMKDIYINTNSSSGLRIKVYSTKEVVDAWQKDSFGNDNAILIFKNIAAAVEVIERGIPAEKLNVGGIAKRPDAKFVIDTVGVTKDDVLSLKKLSDDKQVDVFFQTVPDSKKVELKEALSEFGV
ncbi:PTS system mannose/fructose/N-acetylgalactosamine-transporter subunit IIB [Oenococcus sp.]|uniref:PTS system mannose/fructose/N-acetylgalactosamine-transporter subunit IIB n=1 Tax=Oenococcus sp. TaxID=1979414 RepID=UPI0039E92813